MNDNVVLQSVSTRLTVTVRHVNKKPVCHLSKISSFPHAFVSNLQKKTKIFIEGSKKRILIIKTQLVIIEVPTQFAII